MRFIVTIIFVLAFAMGKGLDTRSKKRKRNNAIAYAKRREKELANTQRQNDANNRAKTLQKNYNERKKVAKHRTKEIKINDTKMYVCSERQMTKFPQREISLLESHHF
jgi:hypothetical protein